MRAYSDSSRRLPSTRFGCVKQRGRLEPRDVCRRESMPSRRVGEGHERRPHSRPQRPQPSGQLVVISGSWRRTAAAAKPHLGRLRGAEKPRARARRHDCVEVDWRIDIAQWLEQMHAQTIGRRRGLGVLEDV